MEVQQFFTVNTIVPKKTSSIVAAASMLLLGSTYSHALEEVIVTAQKRAESVQEIPLSVAVVSGNTLQEFTINNPTDLARSVPGLEIEPAPQGLHAPRIRGLGTGVGAENVEQSVGLFVDGIYSGKPRDLQSALFDVNRVEVIKGTQTSQLGKNTSLGAILVMSNRPEDENGGYAQAEYDFELGSTVLAGAVNLATDFGNYRLAVNLVQEEGFVENLRVGGDGPEREQNSLRLSGLWDLGDRATLYAGYTYDDRKVTGMSFEISEDINGLYQGLTGDTDIVLNNERKASTTYEADGKDLDEQESHRVVLELSYEISDSLDFTALSGYSEYENGPRSYDADFSALDYIQQEKESDFDQFSQEFRLNGSALDDTLDYVAGFFYMENSFENYENTQTFDAGFVPLPQAEGLLAATGPSNSESRYKQDIETWSIYGNGAFQLADRWRLTLGLRYTDETKELTDWSARFLIDETTFFLEAAPGFIVPLPASALPPGTPPTLMQLLGGPPHETAKLDYDEDNLDGSINVQYQFDVGNVYASWARGSKSGGYSSSAGPAANPFDTEEAETTELGIKSELMDGNLRLNAALFYTEIDDFQSVVFVGTGFEAQTVPVESQGVEFESMWAATQNLIVALSATYAEAENSDTGDRPQGAPEWAASLSVNHNLAVGSNYELRTNALINYRDDMYTQTGETYEAPSITLVNLRLAFAPLDGQWELGLMARNLFDEQKQVFGFAFPIIGSLNPGLSNGSYNRPRTVALQARYNF